MKRFVKANSQSALLYFEVYQVDNIGELVADNLTHKYRSEGADFHYVSGTQGYDYNEGTNSITIRCRVSSHYDPEINKNSRYGAYLDSMDFKEFEATQTFRSNRYDTQDSMGRQLVINLTDDIEDQIFNAVNGDIKASTTVKASTGSTLQYADKVEFEDIYPSDRDISFFFTSDDAAYAKKLLGDVEGLVGFSIQVSLPKNYKGDWQEALIYISPKTEDGEGGASDSDWTDITFDISDADMQSLVEQSWAEYKKRGWDTPDPVTDVTSSTKYTADMCSVGASDEEPASTMANSDLVNRIYSVMMNYEYGYDPDMTDINSMLQELTNSGVHVDASDAFKKAWVSAHNKAERKTWGSSDSNHYDSLTPRELEAIENYDTEYWEYVKDHPLNLKPSSIASSIMVSASDEGYEQLAEGDDTDTVWAEPKYHASSYYGKNYSGLEDDFATDDPSALIDWIWDHAANGGYIEVEGPKDRIRLDPDDLAEQVELGGIDEYGIISQIDNV